MNPPPDNIRIALEQLRCASDPEELQSAVKILMTSDHPEALEGLIRAFGFNNPELADLALTGVVSFGAVAVEPLLQSIDPYDYGARAYSVRALARLRDLRSLPLLLTSIQSDFAPSVRRAAVKGIGATVACGDSDQQQDVINLLQVCLQDPDWVIRYASLVSLIDLYPSVSSVLQQQIHRCLDQALLDQDPVIQAKAKVIKP